MKLNQQIAKALDLQSPPEPVYEICSYSVQERGRHLEVTRTFRKSGTNLEWYEVRMIGPRGKTEVVALNAYEYCQK